MYSREIDGTEYTFGVSGKLIMNVLVMYDRQTNSLWAQLLGEAVEGPLKGTELEFVPAVHTTWADWKATHPDTLALVKGYSGDYSGYRSYFDSPRAGVLGEFKNDDRLYIKEFVIGVEDQGQAVAFPFSVLNDQPVVNDQVGEMSILVVFNPDSGAGVVYNRQLEDGTILTFACQRGPDPGRRRERLDLEWYVRTGDRGSPGGHAAGAGQKHASFWFGWKDWYLQTRVFGVD